MIDVLVQLFALACAAAFLPCAESAEEPECFSTALADEDACLGHETDVLNALQLRRMKARREEMTALGPEAWVEQLKKMMEEPGASREDIDETNHWDLGWQFAGQEFEKVHVANDEVEARLPFAKTGSDFPTGFHGVFWLDQYHASSIAKTLQYANSKPFSHPPSDETVVTFGDFPIGYNRQTNCVGPVPNYGGERGHWTFLSTFGGELQLEAGMQSRLTADFCLNTAMDAVDIQAAVLIPLLRQWIFPPSWMFVMRMRKRPWGWDRVTTVGPNVTGFLARHRALLEKILPQQLIALLDIGDSGAFHYPCIQIVDGDGRRTKYYDEYLAYVSGEANDHHQTQVMGVLARPRCDPSLFGTVSRRRRFGNMCSCRRRSSSEGPQANSDGVQQWKCVGNEMEYAGVMK
mmetsp:Transcript_109437/g.266007  ORF Transcript_109437/g.266007 Transcript_109437/m.266007 type:complete len:405 (-) Transcript_109437:54-1268(-)